MNVAVTVNRVSTRLFTPFYENYRGRQDIQDYIRPLNQVLSDFLRVSQRLQTLCCNVIAAVNSYACGQMYFTCGILMPAKASAQPCPVSPRPCRNITAAVAFRAAGTMAGKGADMLLPHIQR